MSSRKKRKNSSGRSILILLGVAVVAVGTLFIASRSRVMDFTLGGPIFPVAAEQIEGILLTKQGQQYRFDRQENGVWSLTGATSDYLDAQAMGALVGVLPMALGGAILPGTETEDRRYEFNGPEAMRLRIFLADGRDITLSMGALNPVNGNYYASGAGRDGCFPVAAPFRDKLFMMPNSVQAKTLLPGLDRSKVQRLILTRSGNEHRFEKQDGFWWLHLPGDDLEQAVVGLPPLVQTYQSLYEDRRRHDEEGYWVLASSQTVGQLIYEVSDIIVREIASPRESLQRRDEWDLNPPWRQVVLQGEGLNPDPSAPVTDQFTIGFGPPLSVEQVPAVRRDNVLITDFEAVNLLDQGLDILVETGALKEVARHADRLELERDGVQLLAATRTGTAVTEEGRLAWQTVFPAASRENLSDKDRHGLSQDLVVNLNRVEVLAVLPPTDDPAVLEARERLRITLTWGEGNETRDLVFEVGYLNRASEGVARTAEGSAAVAMWFPTTGKLLQIPDHLVVSARNMVPLTR